MANNQTDQITRFIFEQHSVRGAWINLSSSLTHLTENHKYPEVVEKQMVESALATNLLATIIKFEGRLSVQAQSSGSISLLLIQADHVHSFRGIARHTEALSTDTLTDTPTHDLRQLMPGAQMAITIEPENGPRYQGIVPMNDSCIATNLEGYFGQSEQLETRIWLFSEGLHGAGLMLQAMPDTTAETDFNHLAQLAQTLSSEEALSLDAESVLHRLFHQDPVRLFEPQSVRYHCGCSRDKSLASMTLVPKAELIDIINEDGNISVNCEFCLQSYKFDLIDIDQIFANSGHNLQSDQLQ